MKINLNQKILEDILNKHFSFYGFTLEEFNPNNLSVILKKKKADNLLEQRRQDFLKKYYEEFGPDASYPFKEKDLNKVKSLTLNVYGVKSDWM